MIELFGSLFAIILMLIVYSFLRRVLRTKPWIFNYLKNKLRKKNVRINSDKPIHIMFLFVDHFEPKEGVLDQDRQLFRVKSWVKKYPQLALKYSDADGKPPQHTWFYHIENWENRESDAVYLKELNNLCFAGFGDIELHVHHGPPKTHCNPDVTTREKLIDLITQLKDFFGQFGALTTAEEVPRKTYGFIHGKWALDNSHQGLYCGVNNELEILDHTGCYADFTMPSGVSITQAKKINSIYYAKSNPEKSKCYDSGTDVTVGKPPAKDLMIFQGPIGISWNGEFLKPSVEDSEVCLQKIPFKKRIDKWINCHISVKDQPNWIFVKIHTHGAREEDFPVFFDEIAENMYSYLEKKYNDGKKYKIHYVSAREAYNIVKAAEAGEKEEPGNYRDYIIKPYSNRKIWSDCRYNTITYTRNLCKLELVEKKEQCRLKFLELLIKEIEGETIKKFEYDHNPEKKCFTVLLTGCGKVKFTVEFPDLVDINSLTIKGASLVSGSEKNERKKAIFELHLKENIVHNVLINY